MPREPRPPTTAGGCRCRRGWPVLLAHFRAATVAAVLRHHGTDCGLPDQPTRLESQP